MATTSSASTASRSTTCSPGRLGQVTGVGTPNGADVPERLRQVAAPSPGWSGPVRTTSSAHAQARRSTDGDLTQWHPPSHAGGLRGLLSTLGASAWASSWAPASPSAGWRWRGSRPRTPGAGRPAPGGAVRAGSPAAASPVATAPAPAAAPVRPRAGQRDELSRLPQATTYGTTEAAPVDLTGRSDGTVVTVDETVAAFARPGGPAVARIPRTRARPRDVAAGARTGSRLVQGPAPVQAQRRRGLGARRPAACRTTTWAVRSTSAPSGDRHPRRSAVGSWAIGHGMADTPTPVGETFLLASFTDRNQSYSPVIFATGSHSDTLDGYGGIRDGGGPRLADPSGRLGAVSHGACACPPRPWSRSASCPWAPRSPSPPDP